MNGSEKGDWSDLPERPAGCFAQKVPVTFSLPKQLRPRMAPSCSATTGGRLSPITGSRIIVRADPLDIRQDLPHNEARRAALSNLADIMGRAAVHSGQMVTWEDAMASNFQWFPEIEELDENGTPPIKANEAGRYPVPVPGLWTEL